MQIRLKIKTLEPLLSGCANLIMRMIDEKEKDGARSRTASRLMHVDMDSVRAEKTKVGQADRGATRIASPWRERMHKEGARTE